MVFFAVVSDYVPSWKCTICYCCKEELFYRAQISKMIKIIIRLGRRICRKIVRPFNRIVHDIFGKYRCSICQKKAINFNPLSAFYFDNFKKYGYKIGPAETCNRDQYTCPHCGASDRDRLHAIYNRKFFGKQLGLDSETLF